MILLPFRYESPFVAAKLNDRRLFGTFLSERGLNGEAVEIGTCRGDFAAAFLDSWAGRKLHLIDPYLLPANFDCDDSARYGENKISYLAALTKLRPHQKRIRWHFDKSTKIVTEFAKNSLDFVYVDGDHREPYPLQDMESWWPKIAPGGILAGHDIHHDYDPDFPWGAYIRKAAAEFALSRNLTVHVVEQVFPGDDLAFYGSAYSFYIEKPLTESVP